MKTFSITGIFLVVMLLALSIVSAQIDMPQRNSNETVVETRSVVVDDAITLQDLRSKRLGEHISDITFGIGYFFTFSDSGKPEKIEERNQELLQRKAELAVVSQRASNSPSLTDEDKAEIQQQIVETQAEVMKDYFDLAERVSDIRQDVADDPQLEQRAQQVGVVPENVTVLELGQTTYYAVSGQGRVPGVPEQSEQDLFTVLVDKEGRITV